MKPWFGPNPSRLDLDEMRVLSAQLEMPARQLIAKATADIDLRPTFASAGPPTLVVCGSHDAATPPRHSRAIAEAIPGCELVIVDDSGHMLIVEQAAVVAETITDWIRRIPAGGESRD